MIKLVMAREEISVLCLFCQDKYKLLNREEKWELAIKEGWEFSMVKGRFIKEIRYE